ncbi:hypothetical protein [Maribellus maritimus]|uniref:hypothetical protein n=1 Tax=Maribellus maritimus TaxID=2870838 RepID=UPI001EEA14C5|nr:hypothetical protein [Maribellus maritimus]MCG6188361.1 hypothetical protein [Maribellus maritimus]
MNMKRKMTIVLAIVTLIGSGILFSCQNSQKQDNSLDDTLDKAEVKFEKFKEDIEDLSEDDPKFVDKLEKKLIEFENNMEELGENVDEAGDQTAQKFNDSMENVRQEARELKNKVSQWSDKTGDNMEELGNEIKEDFENFKESLRDITT